VKLDEKIDPSVMMKDISQHETQLIELAKALNINPKIIVMDEPTSALSNSEVEMLFGIIRDLKKQGYSIVYISHHLSEVFDVADRVTVLRDGKTIATRFIKDVTKSDLVSMMIGQNMAEFRRSDVCYTCDDILEVKGLTHYGYIHDVSFHLFKGEILGVVGLAGSGRTELGRCLSGVDKVDAGEVVLDSEKIKIKNMSQMLDKGVAYLTENRKTEGLALRLANRVNILSSIIPRLSSNGFYFPKRGDVIVDDLYKNYRFIHQTRE